MTQKIDFESQTLAIFRSLDLERVMISQNIFLWKSAIVHSIKLPFDAEVAKKNLKCYLLYIAQSKVYANFFSYLSFPLFLQVDAERMDFETPGDADTLELVSPLFI